jgi:hypothetical protein
MDELDRYEMKDDPELIALYLQFLESSCECTTKYTCRKCVQSYV